MEAGSFCLTIDSLHLNLLSLHLVHIRTKASELRDAGALEFEDDAEGVAEILEEGVGTRIVGDDTLREAAFIFHLVNILAEGVWLVMV